MYDVGLMQEIVKMSMYYPEEWLLNKAKPGDYKEVVSEEDFDEKEGELENLTPKEKRDKRDDSLRRLIAQAKAKIEKKLAFLNTNEAGQKHDVTHKKIMTLLGQPPTLPQESITHNKSVTKNEDYKRESARKMDSARANLSKTQAISLSLPSPRVKAKYLEPQKKGPFDLYFETLNVEIEENKALIRMMYMLMGGLIQETDVNPNATKKKVNFAIEDEARPKSAEEFPEVEENTKTPRGF